MSNGKNRDRRIIDLDHSAGELMMNLQLFEYKCLKCGEILKIPEYSYAYGEFLLKNEMCTYFAYLNVFENTVFDEVACILFKHPLLIDMHDYKKANILQNIFGYFCDKAPDGSFFKINAKPKCPTCGNRESFDWRAIDPPEFLTIDVPDITNNIWNSLNDRQREKYVNDILKEIFTK